MITVTPSLLQMSRASAEMAAGCRGPGFPAVRHEQHPRTSHQRARDQDSLLLATTQLSDGTAGVRSRPDHLEDRVESPRDLPTARRERKRQAPAVAIETEAHQVTGAQSQG